MRARFTLWDRGIVPYHSPKWQHQNFDVYEMVADAFFVFIIPEKKRVVVLVD